MLIKQVEEDIDSINTPEGLAQLEEGEKILAEAKRDILLGKI